MAYGADCAHRRCALPSEPDPASSRSPNLAPTDAESGATERAGHNQCVARRRAPRDRNATQHAHVGYRRIMRTDGHICLSSPSLAQPLPGGPAHCWLTACPARRSHASPLATGSAGVIRRPTPTEPTVTRGTQLDDGDQRLAALWEHELDDAAADAKTADDVIAALFSSSPDDEAHTKQRATTSRTRRSRSRPSGQRSACARTTASSASTSSAARSRRCRCRHLRPPNRYARLVRRALRQRRSQGPPSGRSCSDCSSARTFGTARAHGP